MKYIIIFILFASAPWTSSAFASTVNAVPPSSSLLAAPADQPPRGKRKKQYRPPATTPISPGSKVLLLKDNITAEIRPDKSVWWFGVNQKKAIVADGTHELKDGQKIRTKGGKLVGKMPRLDPKLQPQKSAQ